MEYQQVLKKVQSYAETVLGTAAAMSWPYHNLSHTKKVVDAAQMIANHYKLGNREFFVITVSAWLHDLGYFTGDGTEHEGKGALLAGTVLKQYDVEEDVILEVKNCILATKIPQHPAGLCEQIICDADLFHLGTDGFFESDKLMRREYELRNGVSIDKGEWRQQSIEFLTAHRFHTDYCSILLNPKKQENLERLIKKQKDKHTLSADQSTGINAATELKNLAKEKKAERPVRGIETMFRVASANHQRLSDMADSKSHIMISVNSIIISVVIGLVVRKLETAHNLIIPTMMLLGGSVVAVIFSVLATRPKIPNGYFSPEQLQDRSVNLLFFGNFYKMGYEHYYEGMKLVMNEREFLYASLIKDIHSQGVVLGHKYKLLRISYTIFMFTLIVSVLAFAVTIIFTG